MKNASILFLLPGPVHRPDMPDFKDKYEMLSKNFKGVVLSWTTQSEFTNYQMGSFLFRSLLNRRKDAFTRIKLALFMLKKAFFYHKKERFDVIICYDPTFTGFVGMVLKYCFRCRLIIEINCSNLLEAVSLQKKSRLKTVVKKTIYKFLIFCSLKSSDRIKILSEKQKNILEPIIGKKQISCFHNFVATHCFIDKSAPAERIILFVGYPFYLKGIDILTKSFQKISNKYPNFVLRLIGHRLQEEAKQYIDVNSERIVFCRPVFYDDIINEFLRCYCFVLPSRIEGLPRVLVEAMASEKPIIGSNVGGVPDLIDNGKNGFLFEKEDVDDLASKLDLLLKDPKLAKKMGENGRKMVIDKFSSHKYCDYFQDMIEKTLAK